MCWGQSFFSYCLGIVVSLQGFLTSLVFLIAIRVLGNISVVIGLHLVEENFTFTVLAVWNQELSQQI